MIIRNCCPICGDILYITVRSYNPYNENVGFRVSSCGCGFIKDRNWVSKQSEMSEMLKEVLEEHIEVKQL